MKRIAEIILHAIMDDIHKKGLVKEPIEAEIESKWKGVIMEGLTRVAKGLYK